MPDRRWWQSARSACCSPIPFLLLLFAAAFLVATWLVATPSRTAAEPGAGELPGPAPAPQRAPVAPRVDAAAGPAEAQREPAAAPAPVAEPGFAARVDELVRIGQRTAELAQQDDTAAAGASDREARERFADLMGAFADAGERAIDLLVALPDGATEPLTAGRRIVLQLVLGADCERRDRDAAFALDRERADALVQALLDVMPGTATAAEVGEHVLGRQRFLRLVHEPGVLALVRLAAAGQFSRPIATRMLLTLWDNLQAFGERSSDELSRLALLLLANSDGSQRTAACRQLLQDARYRGFVVSWLREQGDAAVASEVASLAASELPPADAMAVLRELAAVLPQAAHAYLVLGHRAPDAVADGYRELLAANTHAALRRDMLTAVGLTRTPLGRELAELALHSDPAPEVRLQAVFALTAQGSGDLGERALTAALDDPRLANEPGHVAALVLALQNLEATGDTNAIDRIAQRLRSLPLAAESRQRLDALVRRALPGEQPTAATR
jgi:hypothetical protein